MAGLVGYDSSDEDEDVQQPTQTKAPSTAETQSSQMDTKNGSNKPSQSQPSASAPQPQAEPPQPQAQQPPSSSTPQGPIQGPALGPALGPTLPPSLPNPASPNAGQSPSASGTGGAPPSILTLLQDLTLPPVPNTSIPPSPPGSPTPASRTLTAKFENFLHLKQTKGLHFNDRLASSEGFRNPGAMDKLLGFVGVGTDFDDGEVEGGRGGVVGEGEGEGKGRGREREGTGQYENTLPREVFDTKGFPAWAYKTPLRRAQERAARERERRTGGEVEFVSAGVVGGTTEEGRSATPGLETVPSVIGKRKTRFDT